jgi:hypothetical protein
LHLLHHSCHVRLAASTTSASTHSWHAATAHHLLSHLHHLSHVRLASSATGTTHSWHAATATSHASHHLLSHFHHACHITSTSSGHSRHSGWHPTCWGTSTSCATTALHSLHHLAHVRHSSSSTSLHLLSHVHHALHSTHLLHHFRVHVFLKVLKHLLSLLWVLFHRLHVWHASCSSSHVGQGSNLLHHARHFLVLGHQEMNLGDVDTSSSSDSLDSSFTERFDAVKLVLVHRVHSCKESLDFGGRFLFFLFGNDVRVETRDHGSQLTDVTHRKNLGKLISHVTHRELTLLKIFHEFLGLFGGHCLGDFSHETLKISKSKKTFNETCSLK